MNRLAKAINRLFGLDEISERLFGEGPEAPEKRRMWCAWLSVPAAAGAFLALAAGWILLNLLLYSAVPLLVPMGVIVYLASGLAVLIGRQGIDCASGNWRVVASLALLASQMMYLISIVALSWAIVVTAVEAIRLIKAGFGAWM
jgi:hypothetical protein